MKDFFISYNKADRQWAEWIAWLLEDEGYSVVIQCWDFLPGSNFVLEMHEAAKDAERTIGVLSPHFLESMFTQPEWAVAFVKDPTGKNRKLLLIRVQDCQPDGVLAAISYLDLVGLDKDTVRRKILASAGDKRLKPSSPPGFPGDRRAPRGPRFPDALPPIWNVPHLRNPNFTGREQMLTGLHTALNSGQPASWLQALSGLGGKGKTTLAREYAYRYQADYDLVWWVRAEEPASITMDYVSLAVALGMPKMDSPDQTLNAVKGWLGQNRKWLLIFDNSQDPDVLNRFLPQGGGGHVLITSRNPNWGGITKVLPIEVFEPVEAVDFIRKRTNQDDLASAEALAAETGRLPLALEQAGAYIKESGLKLSDYLARFRNNRAEILNRGKPAEYPDTVATTWKISFQAVRTKSPAGADLLVLCSFLAPDNIPRSIISRGAKHFPEPLASAAADEFELDSAVAELRRYSLIHGFGDKISVHQLVQAVTRDGLAKDEQKKWAEISVQLISRNFKFYQYDVETWENGAPLLFHALASAKYGEMLDVAPKATASLLNESALYSRHLGNLNAAKNCFERSLTIAEKNFGKDDPHIATIANNFGTLLRDMGELAEANEYCACAMNIDEKVFGPDHPRIANRFNNLGSILQDQGKPIDAKTYFERALKNDEKAYGENHTSVVRDLNNIRNVLNDLGQPEEARKYLLRGLRIGENVLGEDHPYMAILVNNLGHVLKNLGKLMDAKNCFEKALRIDEKVFGLNHPRIALRSNSYGLTLLALGELQEAKSCFEHALDIDKKAYGQDHTSVARDVNNLGMVLRDLGDLTGAKKSFDRSYQTLQKLLGDSHSSTRIVKANLDTLKSKNL